MLNRRDVNYDAGMPPDHSGNKCSVEANCSHQIQVDGMRPILISQNLKAAEPLRMTNPESSLQEVSLRIVHYQGRMDRLAGGLFIRII